MRNFLHIAICLFLACTAAFPAQAQPVMEKLGRGVVAVPSGDGFYISWRLLADDGDNVTFNIYRSTDGGKEVRLNSTPIAQTTDFTDNGADPAKTNTWTVYPVYGRKQSRTGESFTVRADAPRVNYLTVPLQIPEPGEVGGRTYTYSANDCSVGDLDGDGIYEIVVKWQPSNYTLPPRTGLTGNTIYDAYKMDGTLMWRIDCGINIRSGDAYNQFLVYDLDGDGKAEIAFKTADGTVDGTGHVIGEAGKDWRTLDSNSNTFGKIVNGPEYLTVFEGATGRELATAEYIPTRYPLDGWGGVGGNAGNDATGGRADRMTACVAYLDGHLPSLVMVRGWYGRSVLAAWDFRDGKLTSRWVFDSENADNPYSGQGNHSVSVADFDQDGFDEVCIGAMTVDHDGKGLFTTGLRHGDALHAGDLNPLRPGLEVFGVHETEEASARFNSPGSAMFDGKTGEILWSNNPGVDVGRGVAADIDPDYPGAECWGAPGGTRRGDTGEVIYPETPNSVNFIIWWDADPLRELLDKTVISKWNWKDKTTEVLFQAEGVTSNNGTKSTPALSGDLFGDWREEVMFRTPDSRELRIYTTTIPATSRMTTLMHDPQYRLAICWQNVAYNQPPHPGFFIGEGMQSAPRRSIVIAGSKPGKKKK
ncbi:MAG: rhamnogalacturonan lyase [Bacteroidales bacterium]|nr:rhamnogalacturonan lyase [Bacteroidales bacterium]